MLAAAQRWTAQRVVRLGLADRVDLLSQKRRLYETVAAPELIEQRQVAAFNDSWRRARERYRFYAEWQRRHALTDRIRHTTEVQEFPVLRNADIEANFCSIVEDAAPCRLVRTGGTTGQPRHFPRGTEDDLLQHANMYLGRSWAGINPGDNITLIWSHTHLFGHGLKGHVNVAKRHVKDWLIGTIRLSAYSLDDESLASYLDIMGRRRGTVLVSYASCIRKLLDYVERASVDGASAGIRAVIFCSETVFQRDLDRVRSLLAAVPLIEYGMQETGVMAYSRPDSSEMTFFWDAYHCHVVGQQELVITTLAPVRFPLINYGTGDRVEPLDEGRGPPFRCARILGRSRDILTLTMRDGKEVETHSDFFFDILQIDEGVRSFFIRQKGQKIEIAVLTHSRDDLARIERRFFHEISREFPDLDQSKITFSFLQREPYTVAGKRLHILRE